MKTDGEAVDGSTRGVVLAEEGDEGECVGEKAPCSMGRPVERSEMADGERSLGDEGCEWKAEGILSGGGIPTIAEVEADTAVIVASQR